jgi:hypothetical protein
MDNSLLFSSWQVDAGQQTKELKPGKERSLEEEESQRREERRVGRCKICNFH